MSRVRWDGSKASRLVRDAGMKAIIEVAEDIGTASMDEAPLLSGTLRRSETVTPDRGKMKVYISYNTPYAIKQHEELGYKHPRGGKAKYLEDPLNRKKASGKRYIQRRVISALQKGR